MQGHGGGKPWPMQKASTGPTDARLMWSTGAPGGCFSVLFYELTFENTSSGSAPGRRRGKAR